MKKIKGENGYIDYYKKQYLIISVAFLVAVMTIYIIGNIFAKSYFVYFAVLSALMILPASQYLTKYLLFVRYKSGASDYYEKFKGLHEQMLVLSDLIVVKGKQTLYFDFIIFSDKNILACHKQKSGDVKKNERLQVAKSLLQNIYHPNGYDIPIIVFDCEEELLAYLIKNVASIMNSNNEAKQDKLANLILNSAI
ncbi:MAG: hypothetical protein CVV02_12065 [Firmicutes bacterium HGW-Firmicutes-7]|nr:MAG: hypothetical protein CVV02_12065 [Firmicutes bacterium HGW-Firmicutes-7]